MLRKISDYFKKNSLPKRSDYPNDSIEIEEKPSFSYKGEVEEINPTEYLMDRTIRLKFPVSKEQYEENELAWNKEKWERGVVGGVALGGALYKGYTGENKFDLGSVIMLTAAAGYYFYQSWQAGEQEAEWKNPLPRCQQKRQYVQYFPESAYRIAKENNRLFHLDERGQLHCKTMRFWQGCLNYQTGDPLNAKNTFTRFLKNAPLDPESLRGLNDIYDLSNKKIKHLTTARLNNCMLLFAAANQQLTDVEANHQFKMNELINKRNKISIQEQKMKDKISLGKKAATVYADYGFDKDQHDELVKSEQMKNEELKALNQTHLSLAEKEIKRLEIKEKYAKEAALIKQKAQGLSGIAKAGSGLAESVLNVAAVSPFFEDQRSIIEKQIADQECDYNKQVSTIFSPVTQKIMDTYFDEQPKSFWKGR